MKIFTFIKEHYVSTSNIPSQLAGPDYRRMDYFMASNKILGKEI